MPSFALSEMFPQSTGTRYMVDMHKTLTHALQTRDKSPFDLGTVDTAETDNLALARSTQWVLANSIRRAPYCVNAIIKRAKNEGYQTDLPSLVGLMADTPEAMRSNGLYLLVSLRAPIPQEPFMEMGRRYFQTPQPDVAPPDSKAHSTLLYAATKGMRAVRAFGERLNEVRSEPVFAAALKDAQGWPDASAYFAQHPDPRVPMIVSQIQKEIPDFLAVLYAVNHYLTAAENGETQARGYQDLEVALHGIQRAGGMVPLSNQVGSLTLGTALQNIRDSLPVELTFPERLREILNRIQEQDRAAERRNIAPKVTPDNLGQESPTRPVIVPHKPKGRGP